VLRIASEGGSMLLTGDIERSAEKSLVETTKSVKSDVLLVPHHGSRTSSTPDFIAAVAPRWAVVPVGYRSRFGHPSGEVLERYRAAGAHILRTDLDGAVQVRLMNKDVQVDTGRTRMPRYWRTPPPV
jgi:competence protein ComEC